MLSVKRSHRSQKTASGLGTRAITAPKWRQRGNVHCKSKVVHSQEVLDAKVDCTKSVLEAKCNYRVAIQKAKTIRGSQFQETELPIPRPWARPWPWDLLSLQHSIGHTRFMHELEEEAIREESKVIMPSFPPVKPSCIMLCNPSRRIWIPPTTSCWGNHLHHLHLLHLPGHPWQKNSHLQLPLQCLHPNGLHGWKGGIPCWSHKGACL